MRKICRVLFSRYAISAIMIVLELAAFVLLCIYALPSLHIVAFFCFVAAFAALISLIVRDANPEYKIPWTVIIILLPALGPLMYLLFYKRRMSKRESRRVRETFFAMKALDKDETSFETVIEDSGATGKMRAILNDDYLASVYTKTSSKLYFSGEDPFSDLIKDISRAEKYIFLEYFIIDQGELWDEIHGILREKAARGIDVRLLYDDIGCMKTLPSHYEKGLRREGIKTYRFARVNPRVSSVHHNRDHRKICIVDGKCAYTGGVNIADEYVNKIDRFGHWRDGGIRLEGEAVKGLLKLFLASWDFTSCTKSDYEDLLLSVAPSENADGGYYLPFGSGPAPLYKRPVGKNAFLNVINQAKKYVYITTPYLIIDYDLTEALCNASLRGVDVRIVTPGRADKKIIKILTKSSYPYLIDAGVKIYEYTPGFIHEKTLVSDDEYAIVGTINFDYRSLVHHFEDAVFMYKTAGILNAKEEYQKLLELSEYIDRKKSKLTFSEWIFRNGVRLFAPLL